MVILYLLEELCLNWPFFFFLRFFVSLMNDRVEIIFRRGKVLIL